jgi:hypothetical protein
MPNPLNRRRRANVPEDPTLAEDLLGVPRSTVTEVETIDSSDPAHSGARTGDDEELGRLLAARAPRAHLPWVTGILAAAVLLAAGYVAGGYHYRNSGSGSTAASAFTAARGARTGGAEGFGAGGTGTGSTGGAGTGGGGFGGAGGATIGTVKLVDGNNVYLTTTAGATVKVTLGKGATVTVTKAGTLSDLAPGTSIVVVGTTGADGTVTATAVTQGGAGGFGAGRGAAAGG